MVNYKKATMLFLAGLFCLFFLCSCSLSGSGEENLRYPELSEKEKAVYAFLEEYTQNNYVPVYAARGSHQNPLQFRDLDGDGTPEVIVNYIPDVSGVKTVKTLILREAKNGEYALAGVFNGLSENIDKIEYGDMTGDGREEIIIGYDSLVEYYPSTLALVYYNENTGGYMPGYMADYNEFLCGDFNGDSVIEVLNVSYTGISAIQSTALCLVYDFNLDTFRTLSGGAYISNTDTCYRVEKGNTADGMSAAYITSEQGTMLKSTEILVWNKDSLVPINISTDKKGNVVEGFLYYGTAIAQDIDGDGIMEYPVTDVVDEEQISEDIRKGISSQTREMLQYTCSWYFVEEGNAVYDFSCYLNTDLGYYLAIKNPSYYSDIAVYMDSSDNLLFYYVKEDDSRELLFSIVASSTAPSDKNTQLLYIADTDTYLCYVINSEMSSEAFQKLIPMEELLNSITATGIITVS